eukprot:scaffold80194_cov20-Tisochrysis_lutea.AAC.3
MAFCVSCALRPVWAVLLPHCGPCSVLCVGASGLRCARHLVWALQASVVAHNQVCNAPCTGCMGSDDCAFERRVGEPPIMMSRQLLPSCHADGGDINSKGRSDGLEAGCCSQVGRLWGGLAFARGPTAPGGTAEPRSVSNAYKNPIFPLQLRMCSCTGETQCHLTPNPCEEKLTLGDLAFDDGSILLMFLPAKAREGQPHNLLTTQPSIQICMQQPALTPPPRPMCSFSATTGRQWLLDLLRPSAGGIMWRSSKRDVAHELGIPPQPWCMGPAACRVWASLPGLKLLPNGAAIDV